MLAVFAVVLALAGAPATTLLSCPATIPGGFYGWATWDSNGIPVAIQLKDNIGCRALRYAAASRSKRDVLARDRPHVVPAAIIGIGLLVALHEAEHVGLRSVDECLVEKTALARVPVLLKRFMPRQWRAALGFAGYYDSHLPANYHGC